MRYSIDRRRRSINWIIYLSFSLLPQQLPMEGDCHLCCSWRQIGRRHIERYTHTHTHTHTRQRKLCLAVHGRFSLNDRVSRRLSASLCCSNKGYKRPRRKQRKLIAFAGIADGSVQAFFGSYLIVWERSSLPARYCRTNDPHPSPPSPSFDIAQRCGNGVVCRREVGFQSIFLTTPFFFLSHCFSAPYSLLSRNMLN